MKNELLEPLESILNAADALVEDAYTSLNAQQSQCIYAVRQVAEHLQQWVASMPELNSTSARMVLDFETRSHLASIIGYAEILLDQDEGPLTEQQQQLVHQIRTSGKLVLHRLTKEA